MRASAGRVVRIIGTAVLLPVLLPVLMLPGIVVTAPPAHAQQELTVQVIIEKLAPQIPKNGDELSLSGRVVNTGRTALSGAAVALTIRQNPVRTREAVESAASAQAPQLERTVPGVQAKLPDRLEPGKAAPWSLQVPVARLQMGEPGVYPIGVEVRGAGPRLGLTKTFLPWEPTANRLVPTKAVVLWPVADTPRLGPGDMFADDTLARDLAPGGRLDAVLNRVPTPLVTWVVDPDLLGTVALMGKGYEVSTRSGRKPGAGKDIAARWMSALQAATRARGTEVLALPYADPDLVALRRNGLAADIGKAQDATEREASKLLNRPVRTDVAWPPGNVVDEPTLRAMRSAGTTAVVLDAGAMPLTKELTFTPSGRATIPFTAKPAGKPVDALLADSKITQLLATQTSTPGSAVLVAQRLLAETVLITEERPNKQRTIVLAPPRHWKPDPIVTSALSGALRAGRWLTPTTVSDLRATPPAEPRRGLIYPATARAEELTTPYLQLVESLQRRLARYQSILVKPDRVRDTYAAALLRANSSAWRKSGTKVYRYEQNLRRGVIVEERKIRISSRGRATLSSKEGTIPITVTNSSNQAVKVGLKLDSRAPSRLKVQSAPVREIAPGHQVTFAVRAEAVANGVVVVNTQLLTPSGQPYGEQLALRVRATNYSTVALFVVSGAAGLLFLLSAMRLIRRARGARAVPSSQPEAVPEKVQL